MDAHENTAFHDHDHDRCRSTAMKIAEARLAESGARFTPVRRRTLEILLEQHRALGAYEVLDFLAKEGFGKQPPVAYRALEFLVEHGLAHRIRRLNAFAACLHPDREHMPVFMICDNCESLAEIDAQKAQNALNSAARDLGFALRATTIETVGICPQCQNDAQGQ